MTKLARARTWLVIAAIAALVGCSTAPTGTCPRVGGSYTATPAAADTSCVDSFTMDVVQMGCSAAASWPDPASGRITTGSAAVGASGAWSVPVTLPGGGSPIAAQLAGTFTGDPATGGTLEITVMGAHGCTFTLTR